MKRKLCALLAFVLALCLLATACGDDKNSDKEKTKKTLPKKTSQTSDGGGSGGWLDGLKKPANEIEVPKFIGKMYYTDIEDNEEYRGYAFQIVWEDANDPDCKKGEVFQQNPAAGKLVKKGATITLKVNSGVPKAIKLDVRTEVEGLHKDEVRELLQKVGFVVKESSRNSDLVPLDHVIGINIQLGQEYPYGTEVTMVVSAGPSEEEPLYFPPVMGYDYKQAIEFLKSVGFVGGIDFYYQNFPADRYGHCEKDRVMGVEIDGVLQKSLPEKAAPDVAITLVVCNGLKDVSVALEWPITREMIDVRVLVNGIVNKDLLKKFSGGVNPMYTTEKLAFTLVEHGVVEPYPVVVQIKKQGAEASEYRDYVTLSVDPAAGTWTMVGGYQPLPGIAAEQEATIPADIFAVKMSMEQIHSKLSSFVVTIQGAAGNAITAGEELYVTEIWYNGSLVKKDDLLPVGSAIKVIVVSG